MKGAAVIEDVEIMPPRVDFFDAEAHVTHQMNISIRNLNKKSKNVKFLLPESDKFFLHCDEIEKTIAAGLEATAVIEYYNEIEEDCSCHINVVIDDKSVKIPVFVHTPKPILSVSNKVDFGTLVADGRLFNKEISILNHGVKEGDYNITQEKSSAFRILPLKGTVLPGYSQPIRFEFISKSIGKFKETFTVSLEGSDDEHITVQAEVVSRSLQLLSVDNKESVSCVKFGQTYYGTNVVSHVYLYNNSPNKTAFVVLLEDDGEGQEPGVDITKSFLSFTQNCLEVPIDSTQVVTAQPSQGELEAYQKKKILLVFSPRYPKPIKGWQNVDNLAPRQDYALFMKFECVGSKLDKEEMKAELALTGTALPVMYSLERNISFKEPVVINKQADTCFSLNNDSLHLPFCFTVKTSAHFTATPSYGYVGASSYKQIMLTFKPSQIGELKSKVKINIIGHTCVPGCEGGKLVFKKTVIESEILNCCGVCVFAQSAEKKSKAGYRVAHPNELAASIRPSNRDEVVKTKHTKQERYADLDYSYTDEENTARNLHKKKYSQNRNKQTLRKGEKATSELVPPKITTAELKQSLKPSQGVNMEGEKLLTSKMIGETEELNEIQGLKASPTTSHEQIECTTVLTPKQLIQVLIEPSVLDFGKVCCKSAASLELTIANKLPQSVMFLIKSACREIRHSAPTSQVIPPKTLSKLHFVLETSKLGTLEKNIDYCINGHHLGHILVRAQVVHPELKLSTQHLSLYSVLGMPAESGLRKCVTLINERNLAVDFSWSPVVDNRGTAFTIRPVKGTVPAFSEMNCEVTFYPSFSCAYEGQFVCKVNNRNPLTLNCSAQLGPSSCSFMERRLLFGVIPLNLTSQQSAFLRNTGSNHVYFKVVDTKPLEGMLVSPAEGVIPIGGKTELKFAYKPPSVHNFDTNIEVEVLGWKNISIRLGGSVEYPNTNILVEPSFNFGGVYKGSTSSIPFKLVNVAKSCVEMSFDMSDYRDFKITGDEITESDGLFHVALKGEETRDAQLQFTPTEVASYDFILGCTVNQLTPPSPPPSPYPASPKSISQKSKREKNELATPRRRVQAVGMRDLLRISQKHLLFQMSEQQTQSITVTNDSRETITWGLETCALFDQGVLSFTHQHPSTIVLNPQEEYQFNVVSKPSTKSFTTQLALILHKSTALLYAHIGVSGEVVTSQVTFEPKFLQLPLVPLSTEASKQLEICVKNQKRVEVEPALVNGTTFYPDLTVEFINTRNSQPATTGDSQYFKCVVKFSSQHPVSFATNLLFSDGCKTYPVRVEATADNSLLTCHQFMACNQQLYRIVCNNEEGALVPCISPIREPTLATRENSSTVFSISSFSETPTTTTTTSSGDDATETTTSAASNHGFELILTCGYEEENLRELLTDNMLKNMKTVQRWFSSQGWSSGPFPITLPFSLRDHFTAIVTSVSNAWNKENKLQPKSVIDLVKHLCGRSIPGVSKDSLPKDTSTRLAAIHLIYKQTIDFLQFQNAMLSSVRPEYLLHPKDYAMYCKQENTQPLPCFEIVSMKSWTTLLIQIYKVFVLACVSVKSLQRIRMPDHYEPLPRFNSDATCSNIYSLHERVLLAWLNHHYQHQLITWKQLFQEEAPSSRWIVNFGHDLVDGLVLALLISAHAPYLRKSHLHPLYARPTSAEQCLHNALKVIEALRFLKIDYDILATDITEPCPINMLMLCVYLYQHLPNYLPTSTVSFQTSLHTTVAKKVKIRNPSKRNISYEVILAGEDAKHFKICNKNIIQVSAKSEEEVQVEYASTFLTPFSATLLLVGRRGLDVGVAQTLSFTLHATANKLTSTSHVTCGSPCYELHKLNLTIKSPYPESATFQLQLIEPSSSLNQSTLIQQSSSLTNGSFSVMLENKKKQLLSVFWTRATSVHFDSSGTSQLEVQFLPFEMGTRHCCLLFTHPVIGQFAYTVEATARLPLASRVPFERGQCRVTSAIAMQKSCGMVQEDDTTVYLQCEPNTDTVQELSIDVINKPRESAMVVAAQQRMSERELKRRELTGITSCNTIISSMAAIQLDAPLGHPTALLTGVENTAKEFTVEVTNPKFEAPPTLLLPAVCHNKSCESVRLAIRVLGCKPGQYSCDVILRALNDIRVYHIECTVNSSQATVQLEYTTQAKQSLMQNIPVVNHSDRDWNMSASIEAQGFHGPAMFTATHGTTTFYPLTFRPIFEGPVTGALKFTNVHNGSENKYLLRGMATEPKPLDEIHIDCIVNEGAFKMLELYNELPYKAVFQAFSDISIISGPAFITVLSRQTVQVPINIQAIKRGRYEGIVSFIYDAENRLPNEGVTDEATDERKASSSIVFMSSSSSQFADLHEAEKLRRPLRVFYKLSVNALPTPPLKTLQMTSCVYSSSTMELVVRNPTEESLQLDVVIDSECLTGEAKVTVPANDSIVYQISYTPLVIGRQTASVIFQGESFAEFWYEFHLIGKPAMPHVLPTMKCCLGSSTGIGVRLKNHSRETIVYQLLNNNKDNFWINTSDKQLVVCGQSEVEVPIVFTPCSISDQIKGEVVFKNEKSGNQTFVLSGVAELPLISEEYTIQSCVRENAATIIIFTNPFNSDAIVDVTLTDDNGRFDLLLNDQKCLGCPKGGSIDIPISYSPLNMASYLCKCDVTARSVNHAPVTWCYVIKGVPTCAPVKESHAPLVTCRARERIEERLEVVLTNERQQQRPNSPLHLIGNYVVSAAIEEQYTNEEGEFSFQLQANEELHTSVALTLQKKLVHRKSNVITLVFHLVFSPLNKSTQLSELEITTPEGGVWKYPLVFQASAPTVDDVITIESIGLNKTSSVSFRIDSRSRETCAFEAFFDTSLDHVFTVSPTSGTLPPENSDGMLFTVGYKPHQYGTTHKAKLVIQTDLGEWLYEVNGTTPSYQPPRVKSLTQSHRPEKAKKPAKNFVRKNLAVSKTAVSSPIKASNRLPFIEK